ncbi:hypothetical protein [Actinoplanes sp. NPDC026619]|uniref:hypothetical protein n=1 Tax=Actinoplanes sp. NPDC026619 TaxID=3155798 RepID=UPI0034004B7E
MNQSTERELRELFAADAAEAPDELVMAAAAVRRVHRRRRTLTVAVATTTLLIAAGVYGVHRPAATPQAQPPATSSSAPVSSAPVSSAPVSSAPVSSAPVSSAPVSSAPVSSAPVSSAPVSSTPAADLPAGVKPGDPLAFGAAQCVKEYSPETLAENAFAFDGTVTRIGPARTERSPRPDPLDLRSVTFQVHTWFKGGAAGTAVVDMDSPAAGGTTGEEGVPAYQIGTRLLVSGMPRWGGAPLTDAIAWGCGFTRYYSPSTAATWATATN